MGREGGRARVGAVDRPATTVPGGDGRLPRRSPSLSGELLKLALPSLQVRNGCGGWSQGRWALGELGACLCATVCASIGRKNAGEGRQWPTRTRSRRLASWRGRRRSVTPAWPGRRAAPQAAARAAQIGAYCRLYSKLSTREVREAGEGRNSKQADTGAGARQTNSAQQAAGASAAVQGGDEGHSVAVRHWRLQLAAACVQGRGHSRWHAQLGAWASTATAPNPSNTCCGAAHHSSQSVSLTSTSTPGRLQQGGGGRGGAVYPKQCEPG